MNANLRNCLNLPTDTPLKFWLKYWKYYIKELCDLDTYDIQLSNPHFLLKEVVSEIEYNDFKNKDNRELFKCLLSRVLKEDFAFTELYKTEIQLALNKWDISPLIIKNICNTILQSMDNNFYLQKILSKLQSTIESGDELNERIKENICLYTELLIQEFICLGVDVHDIDRLIEEDDLIINDCGDVIICDNSFYELRIDDFASKEEYYSAVSHRYKNRCINEYLNNILSHFQKAPEDGIVILRLLGIKGSINQHFGDIHLYSIDNTTYLPADSFCKIEEKEAFLFVNVAVKVKHRFFNTSLNYATQKVFNLLDYLSFNLKTEDELTISKQFATIMVNGNICGSTSSVQDDPKLAPQYRGLRAVDITPLKSILNDWLIEFVDKNKIDNKTFIKLSNSTHWYKKAISANKEEDKLLYSWIALESVLKIPEFTKQNFLKKGQGSIDFVKEICSCIISRNKFFNYAKNIYLYLVNCTQQYDNYYDFEQKTIKNAKLDIHPGEEIKISCFLKYLPDLKDEINDEVFKRELANLETFYSNKNGFGLFKTSICNDIVQIYRLRNMIVHNAVCPEFLIKSYAYKAQFIAGSVINALRHHFNKYNCSIEEALIKIYSQCQIFESNIPHEIKRIKGLVV